MKLDASFPFFSWSFVMTYINSKNKHMWKNNANELQWTISLLNQGTMVQIITQCLKDSKKEN